MILNVSPSGTGEIIRGQAVAAGERGHGDGQAIAAAGRDEVHRGLDKLEGKSTTTSTAAGDTAVGPNQRGVDDTTGAASGPAPTAPQGPAAAPRADPNAGQTRGDAGANGYLPDKRTAAAEGDTFGRRSDRYGNEQIATTAAPRDQPAAADGPGVQRNANVPQRGFEKRRAVDEQTTNASQRPGNVAGQEEFGGTADQAAAASSQPFAPGYEARS